VHENAARVHGTTGLPALGPRGRLGDGYDVGGSIAMLHRWLRRGPVLLAVGVLAATGVAAARSPVRTVRQFDRLSFHKRERFAVHYMTTHPDHVCYGGRPTPRRVAENVKAAMAQISPAISRHGPKVTAGERIGKAIRDAEAAIGC
jgi:hypothetical protein